MGGEGIDIGRKGEGVAVASEGGDEVIDGDEEDIGPIDCLKGDEGGEEKQWGERFHDLLRSMRDG